MLSSRLCINRRRRPINKTAKCVLENKNKKKGEHNNNIIPVDIGPKRWAYGQRSGGDLPASSLPPSPVATGAAHYGVCRAVATLGATYRRQPKKETRRYTLLLVSPICHLTTNKQKTHTSSKKKPLSTMTSRSFTLGLTKRHAQLFLCFVVHSNWIDKPYKFDKQAYSN